MREIRDYLETRLKIAGEKPDYVVIGDVRECRGFEEMNRSLDYLMSGARLIGLQPGRFFLSNDQFHIDTGGYVKMLEYASKKRALFLGKPSPHFFRLAIRALGGDPAGTVVVGDDVTTDVAGARRIGSFAVAVRTGKFGLASAKSRNPGADFVVDSIADVPDLLVKLPPRRTGSQPAGRYKRKKEES